MYLVGLTGGIGSGKSTVARHWAAQGIPVIDADGVARELVEPGEPVLAELATRFGDDLVDDHGRLDRAGLAAVVFADASARRDLDRIMHPRIAARIAERIAVLGTGPADEVPPLVVVDHPLLIETGQTGRFDTVVVVLAPEAVRLRRLVELRGLDEADARARLASQTDDTQRRRLADHVIHNDRDLEALLAAADEVRASLLEAASEQG